MSADQLASSFGDPIAQPPTPKRTPASPIFPSPVFETPKNNQARFDESNGWTPRFAEEYSVFNTTPGNLRGNRNSFPDFGPATPFPAGADQKQSSSAGGFATEVATHVNDFSPNPILPLPSVEPAKMLQTSPTSLRNPSIECSVATDQSTRSVGRSVKKWRRNTVAVESRGQTQTATPPPSARKGERKLAPKVDTLAMQNDQGLSHQTHFMASGQQQGMGGFVAAQSDLFGYPLSAPATAPAYGAQKSFWDPNPSFASMDIDFGSNGGDVFQPTTPHQAPGAVNWARANQMLQSPGGIVGLGDGHAPAGDNQPALVSQTAGPMLVTSSAEQAMFAVSYPAHIDHTFRINDDYDGVNPGLLFSRPQSANLDTASVSQSMQAPGSSCPAASQDGQPESRGPSAPKATGRGELRRSASAKEVTPSKESQGSANSPVKSAGRPGLSRSVSENRGRRGTGRPSLPPLAPAPRPQSQLMSNAGVGATRPVISQPQRPSGRVSPSKSSHRHHHHRLSSLSSIPEISGPQTRTQAKFTIDANGRARVETTVVVVDEPSPGARNRHGSYSTALRQKRHSSDDDDDSSSTDDEPIIIPSRNASFALPDPRKPTTIHPFHNSQRSISERSTTSYTTFQGGSQDDADSDAETVLNDVTPTRKGSGDAASELRKLRENRQRQRSASKQKRFGLGSSETAGFANDYPAAGSPTTLSDTSLSTPTSDSKTRGVRCVCNRAEAGRNELLVQCESCESWVHGQCVSITPRTMPSIYICAFCANTPNMRGGRLRDSGRVSGAVGPPASSPLAHKSLKSFR
ncbi:hypothetical protein VTK56DRAFT_5198 [Thermocarpiscus australiensis]